MKKILIAVFIMVLLSLSVSADCFGEINAKSAQGLLENIPLLNSKLSTCGNAVPSPADKVFKDEIVSVKIFMQGGSTEPFTVTVQNGKITKIEKAGASNPTFIVGLGECELDTILRSQNPLGAVAYLYLQNKVQLTAVGFWKKVKFAVAKVAINSAFKKMQTPETIACSTAAGTAQEKKEVGEICQHGGQCKTGNCLGVGQGPPWTYRCSCDPYKYVDTPGCPKTPTYPESGQGKPGDICQHGGQCESGNCIGVIPGQLYKCSCDPFKYVEYGC